MVEHKIQSREQAEKGGLVIELDPVPKKLGFIKTDWCPKAFLISFKVIIYLFLAYRWIQLETDISILEKKALGAIQAYGVDMVIANELYTNRFKVVIYHKSDLAKENDRGQVIQISQEKP